MNDFQIPSHEQKVDHLKEGKWIGEIQESSDDQCERIQSATKKPIEDLVRAEDVIRDESANLDKHEITISQQSSSGDKTTASLVSIEYNPLLKKAQHDLLEGEQPFLTRNGDISSHLSDEFVKQHIELEDDTEFLLGNGDQDADDELYLEITEYGSSLQKTEHSSSLEIKSVEIINVADEEFGVKAEEAKAGVEEAKAGVEETKAGTEEFSVKAEEAKVGTKKVEVASVVSVQTETKINKITSLSFELLNKKERKFSINKNEEVFFKRQMKSKILACQQDRNFFKLSDKELKRISREVLFEMWKKGFLIDPKTGLPISREELEELNEEFTKSLIDAFKGSEWFTLGEDEKKEEETKNEKKGKIPILGQESLQQDRVKEDRQYSLEPRFPYDKKIRILFDLLVSEILIQSIQEQREKNKLEKANEIHEWVIHKEIINFEIKRANIKQGNLQYDIIQFHSGMRGAQMRASTVAA